MLPLRREHTTQSLLRFQNDGMPLIEFWSKHTTTGLHPADASAVNIADHITWNSSAQAAANAAALKGPKSLFHQKLHLGLFPQPFVGNIRQASVYLLFGNPGLSPQDYIDELDTPKYRAHCIANLAGQVGHFGPLHQDALHTGAYKYWSSTFSRLIKETGEKLELSVAEARAWVLSQVATIEAGAYHSPKFPVDVFDKLPSTKAAHDFVHGYVMGRLGRGECVVFVWRQARLWKLDEQPGVMIRDPRMAFGRYLFQGERKFMVDKLVEVFRRNERGGRVTKSG